MYVDHTRNSQSPPGSPAPSVSSAFTANSSSTSSSRNYGGKGKTKQRKKDKKDKTKKRKKDPMKYSREQRRLPFELMMWKDSSGGWAYPDFFWWEWPKKARLRRGVNASRCVAVTVTAYRIASVALLRLPIQLTAKQSRTLLATELSTKAGENNLYQPFKDITEKQLRYVSAPPTAAKA
eukprot:gene8898-8056_t